MSANSTRTPLDPEDLAFIERLRGIYSAYPPHSVSTENFSAAGLVATRHRGRGIAAASSAAALVAACVIGGFFVAGNSDTSRQVAPTTDNSAPDRTVSAVDVEQQLYRIMDARPAGTPFFFLQVNPASKQVTFWGDKTDSVVQALETAAVDSGYTLRSRAVPPESEWPDGAAENLSQAADQIRTRLEADPDAGFVTLKNEGAINTLVVWRTTQDESTDRELEQIARTNSVTLLLRTAPTSQADAEALGEELRNDSVLKGRGFVVLGAYATSSGAVVTVTGDVDAAREALKGNSSVFAVQADVSNDTPGSL